MESRYFMLRRCRKAAGTVTKQSNVDELMKISVEIDYYLYKQWLEIGQCEGLHTSSAITRFLISLYFRAAKNGELPSGVRCHFCNNLLVHFCFNCRLVSPSQPSNPEDKKTSLHASLANTEETTDVKPDVRGKQKTSLLKSRCRKQRAAAAVELCAVQSEYEARLLKPQVGPSDKKQKSTNCVDSFAAKNQPQFQDLTDVGESETNICRKDDKDSINQNIKKDVSNMPEFHCQLCENVFGTETLLLHHKSISHRQTCGASLDSLKTPVAQSETSEPFFKKSFKSSNTLQSHKRTDTPPQEGTQSDPMKEEPLDQFLEDSSGPHPDMTLSYQCSMCDKSFKSRNALQQHHQVHTRQQHQCSFCGLSFKFPSRLDQHVRTHGQDRPHICEHCGKSFISVYYLRDHMKIHSDERRYKCDVCGASFKQKPSLYAHSKKHTNAKPFQCQYCGLKFRDSQKVKIHVRSHTGERPYRCMLCEATFVSNSNMRQHTAYVHGMSTKTHQCPSCSLDFAAKGKLKIHMKNTHGDLTKESDRKDEGHKEPSAQHSVMFVSPLTDTDSDNEIGSAPSDNSEWTSYPMLPLPRPVKVPSQAQPSAAPTVQHSSQPAQALHT